VLEDEEPEDEGEEEAAPRLTRVRRPRKRKKRLSLTTSPGLLSAIDRSSLNSTPRTERPAQTRNVVVSATRPTLAGRIDSSKPVVQMRTVALDSPFAESMPSPLDRVPSAKSTRTDTLPPSAAANQTSPSPAANQTSTASGTQPPPSAATNQRPIAAAASQSPPSAAGRPAIANQRPASAASQRSLAPANEVESPRMLRAVAPPPRPAGERAQPPQEFSTARPSWQESRPGNAFEDDAPARSPDIDALLAQAAEESRVDWTSASTFPPVSSRKRVFWAIAGVLLALVMLAMFMAHPSKSPYVAPDPTATAAPPPQAAPSPPASVIEKSPEPTAPAPQPMAAAEPTRVAEAPAAEPQNAAGEAAPPSAADSAGQSKDILARAQKLEAQGKPKQALSLYEAAAEQMPTDTNVLSRLAFGYLNRGRGNDAASFAARAVERDSSNAEGWIVLGAARDQLGDHKGARDAYKKCAELGKGSYVNECRNMVR
jgi:tetratricopeptide (TPR) repeat protein